MEKLCLAFVFEGFVYNISNLRELGWFFDDISDDLAKFYITEDSCRCDIGIGATKSQLHVAKYLYIFQDFVSFMLDIDRSRFD